MKKFCIYLLAALLIAGIPLTVAAQEIVGPTICADSAAAALGQTVTVPVRISGNPGFTNFAIAIKFDTEALRLERIDTVEEGENGFLCPQTAAVNTAYVAEEGAAPCGFVSGAASEPIVGDGILFTVTFQVLKQTAGEVDVELDLQYLRSGDVLTSVFTALTTSVQKGTVRVVVKGDLDGDESITDADAAFVYRCINEALEMTDAQRITADVNGDGMVDTTDAALIYRIVHNTLEGFPNNITEEVTK